MVQKTNPVDAPKVTKPIQLLAAWLAGLIAINGSFLSAAAFLERPDWAAGALVTATIANVPIFLACLFLLQTKFRPEMQEDSYYARHLERKYSDQMQKMTVVNHDFIARPYLSQTDTTDKPRSALPYKRRPSIVADLAINDLLPNYDEIVDALASSGIRPSDTFGSTSEDPKVPKPFIVSIGGSVPYDIVRKIVDSISHLGVDGFGYSGPPFSDRIYIGAYSYEDGKHHVPIESNDGKYLLDSKTPANEFFDILRRYDPGDYDPDADE